MSAMSSTQIKKSTRRSVGRTMDVAIKWNVDVYMAQLSLFVELFFALYFVYILDAVLYFRLSGDKFLLFFLTHTVFAFTSLHHVRRSNTHFIFSFFLSALTYSTRPLFR